MGNGFVKVGLFTSKKHNLAVIRSLLKTPQGAGFNSLLKMNTPITPRVLSARLSELEGLGLVQKNLVLGPKPKIEYRALPKAGGLKKAIAELEKWGSRELQ